MLVALRALIAADPPSADADRMAAWKVLDHSLSPDESAEHREQALDALAGIGDGNADAIRRADTALHDKSAAVRRSAAIALGQLRAYTAMADLENALNDTPEVSFAAAEALTELGDAHGRNVLIAVIAGERKDAPGMFTNARRDAAERLHHPASLLLMGSEDAAGAMFGPASMVIPAVKDATGLEGKNAPGRAAAVAYLAKYPDAYAVPLLEWALNDDSEFVRLEAAKALGERGDAGSVAKLDPLLADRQNMVRDASAASILRILGRDGKPGAIAPGPVGEPKTTAK